MISGNKESFHDNNSVFITEQLAMVLFGDQDPVGKIISVKDSPYIVGGVLKNHPLNSSFYFNAVAPIHEFYKGNNIKELNWGNIYEIASTFILVKDQKQIEAIEKSLQTYVPVVNDVNYHQVERFYLAPFKDMAHRGRSITGHPFQPSIHPAAVLPPLIAAICILLIACLNLTNTTIAIAGKRLKEIGIRKVFGASVPVIIKILIYEFLVILTIGSIAGIMAGYYLNVALMDSIWEYFTDLTAITFIIPVISIFVVSVITVSGKVYYAVTRNPLHSLRHE